MSDACPVQIGQVVYAAHAWSYGDKWVPCPVCYGKLFATLELGNGERVPVECEACGLGYDGPRGVINEPCAGSRVDSFVVAGFIQEGDGWKIFDYQQCGRKWGVEVFATAALAEARRVELYAEALEAAANQTFRRRDYLRKKPTWSVRYHREKIRNAEREIAWHSRKLSDALARHRQAKNEPA